MFYVGVIDGADDAWGVRLPDLPGCVGMGGTIDEAVRSVTTALRDVAEHRAGQKLKMPSPSSLASVLASGEVEPGETTVLIPLIVDAGRTVRANLTVDAGLLEAVDAAAGERGITRSAFFAGAAREKLERRAG